MDALAVACVKFGDSLEILRVHKHRLSCWGIGPGDQYYTHTVTLTPLPPSHCNFVINLQMICCALHNFDHTHIATAVTHARARRVLQY